MQIIYYANIRKYFILFYFLFLELPNSTKWVWATYNSYKIIKNHFKKPLKE